MQTHPFQTWQQSLTAAAAANTGRAVAPEELVRSLRSAVSGAFQEALLGCVWWLSGLGGFHLNC